MEASSKTYSFLITGSPQVNQVMQTKDWSTTHVGPQESWPFGLTSVLHLCHCSPVPMAIFWGPDLVVFHNDAFIPILGDKWVESIGQAASDVWSDIWHIVGHIDEQVFATGEAAIVNDQFLPLNRLGFIEECYCAWNMTPIKPSGDRIEGVMLLVNDVTYRVLNERRQKVLRELTQQTSSAKTTRDVFGLAATILEKSRQDVPFSLMYSIDRDGRQARLVAFTGIETDDPLLIDIVDLEQNEDPSSCKWPISTVFKTGTAQKIPNLFEHFGVNFKSYWLEDTHEALLLPIQISEDTGMLGVLIVGASPRSLLNDDYRTFFDLVTKQIANAYVNARACEEEQLHTKQLEELDRAKTVFFSNISHEFRTPLTLILDPLEETLADQIQPLPDHQFKRIEMVKRNAVRLLKLVNSLLDFSRMEAGRMQVHYAPTDISKQTANLASVFRSAIEKAGLEFNVNMNDIHEKVYLDSISWEKIIFNLLSNALKFTHQGSITMTLQKESENVVLQVIDTGIGIPKQELPLMFERFHRIENANGRSQDGSGIGLALTHDLVTLHGGTIHVESEEDKGSIFTISIPLGKRHLPPDRVHEDTPPEDNKPSTLSVPYVEEALCWLPPSQETLVIPDRPQSEIRPLPPARVAQSTVRETILLADDNPDMREYVGQLLSQHWRVYSVADGVSALKAARNLNPALILTDVMMPKMDGLQLTQELRQDPKTALIPIILVSARAGEESSREGLKQGADDYIVKPFTANGLIDRVRTHMELGKLRIQLDKAVKERTKELQETISELKQTTSALRKSQESYHRLASISPAGIFHYGIGGRFLFLNEKVYTLTGLEKIEGDEWISVLHPKDKQRVASAWKDFTEMKTDHFKQECQFIRHDGSVVYVIGEAVAEKDDYDQVRGYVGALTDISELKLLEQNRLEASQLLEEQQRRQVQQAESSRKNLEGFINMVCHEIRNPLMGIFGNVSYLQDSTITLKTFENQLSPKSLLNFQELERKFDESLKQIEQCVNHQKVIADDVLDLSKLESGKANSVIQSVGLKNLINEVVQIFKAPISLKKLELILEIPGHAPELGIHPFPSPLLSWF